MKRIFLIFISMSLFLNISYGVVSFNIDEGFGGVIFDSANVGHSGVIVNKPKNVQWKPLSKHGIYSVGFIPGKGDAFNILDYPQLTPQTGNFTLEIDYLPITQIGFSETVFEKVGSYSFTITPTINPIPPNIKIPEGSLTLNIGLANAPIIIPISNISYGNINTLTISYNRTHYSIYNDGILQGLPIFSLLHFPLTPLAPLTLFDKTINAGLQLGTEFTGLIDEFIILNNYLNSSQVLLNIQPGTILINPNKTKLINDKLILNITSPTLNQSFIENVDFSLKLSETGTCNLYLDNNFKKTYNNVLVFNDRINFANNYGTHSYFFNCFNPNFNEISNVTNFRVTKNPNSHIRFSFTGTDFIINNLNLEVVTPCLNKGYTLGGIVDGYRPIANSNGAQFHNLVNGIAELNLSVGKHEFCLINGIVTYNSYNHTNVWSANVVNQILLGTFDVPSNITSTYLISLDTFDMYGKTNPKAWGQSWTSLISSILAFILGLIILGAGATSKSGQAVMIGGLLILFSLGYQISNLIIGVLV